MLKLIFIFAYNIDIMSIISDKHIYYFNSNNSLYDTDKEYSFSFPIDTKSNWDYCVIQKLSLPKSYYLIAESTGRKVTLIEAGVETIITFPEGNYSVDNFATALKLLLNQSSTSHWQYDCTNNTITGKFIFSVTGNDSQPSFKFGDDSICEQFGFGYNETVTFVNNSITSEYVCNFQKERTIFLKSDIVQDDENHVLAEIYIDTPDYGNVLYTCPDTEAYAKKIQPNTKIIKFRLENESGKQIELNGQNVVFSIMFFQKTNINDKLKEFMQYIYESTQPKPRHNFRA